MWGYLVSALAGIYSVFRVWAPFKYMSLSAMQEQNRDISDGINSELGWNITAVRPQLGGAGMEFWRRRSGHWLSGG